MPEFMNVAFRPSCPDERPSTLSCWNVVELGCGTGRITMALLDHVQTKIYGLDVSEQMLKVAKFKVKAANLQERCKFFVFDAFKSSDCPTELSAELPDGADSVVSALVIEHLPLDVFFRAAKKVLKAQGTLLLTNMHSDMGAISQAGFVKDGIKIRPKSYSHTIQQVLKAATEAGFERIGEIRERAVTDKMVDDLGPRARKWVGVKVWFSICFRRI